MHRARQSRGHTGGRRDSGADSAPQKRGMEKRMIREKSCGALVYRKKQDKVELLLIKHRNGGHWSFPKGHVESGENEYQTALREIKEETGLDLLEIRHVMPPAYSAVGLSNEQCICVFGVAGGSISPCKETGEEKTILFGLTGTGYFDMVAYEKFHDGTMTDYIPTDAEIAESLSKLPKTE